MNMRPIWTPDMIVEAAREGKPLAVSEVAIAEPRQRSRRRGHKVELAAVNAHIGQRLRDRRVMLGMNQSDLGERLGLTFQQVQKYEKGATRITGALLWQLVDALDVPVGYFFDGLSDSPPPSSSSTESGRTLLMLARNIANLLPDVRQAMIGLVQAAARHSGEQSDA